MRRIFESAQRVLVRLGHEEDKVISTASRAACDVVQSWLPSDDDCYDVASFANARKVARGASLASLLTLSTDD